MSIYNFCSHGSDLQSISKSFFSSIIFASVEFYEKHSLEKIDGMSLKDIGFHYKLPHCKTQC